MVVGFFWRAKGSALAVCARCVPTIVALASLERAAVESHAFIEEDPKCSEQQRHLGSRLELKDRSGEARSALMALPSRRGLRRLSGAVCRVRTYVAKRSRDEAPNRHVEAALAGCGSYARHWPDLRCVGRRVAPRWSGAV